MGLDADLKKNMMDGANGTNLGERVPTKRQMDEMNMMLDESISPKADWDDPADVLAWMEESKEMLSDPSFASLIYKDGKTPGEVMLDMLKDHGYGTDFLNDSAVEKQIRNEMVALEKQTMNDKMVALESQIYGPSDFSNTAPLSDTPASETKEPIDLGEEERDNAFYNQILGSIPENDREEEKNNHNAFLSTEEINELLSGMKPWNSPELEEKEQAAEMNNTTVEGDFGLAEPEQKFNNNFFRTDIDQAENTAQEQEEDNWDLELPSWLNSSEDSSPSFDVSEEQEEVSEMEEEVENQTFQNDIQSDNFDQVERKSEPVEEQIRVKKPQPFFTVQPKMETPVAEDLTPRNNTNQVVEESAQRAPSFFTDQSSKKEVEERKPSFFTRQPKENESRSRIERVEEEFSVPSNNIQENLAAINYAIATRDAKDIEQAEKALAALPQGDATTAHFQQQIAEIKEELGQAVEQKQQGISEELRAFQEKYGPSANEQEMQIVNRLENEITTLETRRQEIIDRLNVIKEELKDQKVKQVEQPVQTKNKVDRSKIEQALQEIHEKEKNSTRKLRNNEAMPDFYKAVETHQIMDIVRASNAVESLGTNHLFYGSLNSALNEVANAYYGKTIEGLKTELKETSREFKEALDLLELDAKNQVLAGRVGPLKEAFNQITTDRSKERMLTAIGEIQKLGAEHPYAKRLTKALNGMSNIYYGKTAEELQRQIAECEKATREVHEKIEKDRKKEQFLYDDDTKGRSFDFAEAIYNQAVLEPSKENILGAVAATLGLAQNRESTIALNNALAKLTETYLDTSLNELKKKDLTQSIENVQKSYAQIPESAPIEDALEDAIMAFNKATQTKEKGDIIVAFNMAKKVTVNHELGLEMVNTLDKLALVHYGVDASTITEQFKKYSGALNEVNDLVSPNSKKTPEDAKQNEAMPYFYKAIQTKDIEDIKVAIDEVNKLPDYHPLKQPLLNALNAEMSLVGKVSNTYILEENEDVIREEEESSKELQEEATDLINECKEIDEKLSKYNQSLDKYKENKKKETEKQKKKQEKEEEEDLEPPAEIISDATNKNPGLFKKAIAGAKEALSQIKISKKGVASVLIDASLIGLSIVTAQGAIPLVAYLGYKYSNKYKKMKKKKKEQKEEQLAEEEEMEQDFDQEDEFQVQEERWPVEKDPDMTSAIIENGMQAIKQRDLKQKQGIQYYELNGSTWNGLGDAIEARNDVINAITDGRTVGFTTNEDEDTMPLEIPADYLGDFISKNNGELPSSEEIQQLLFQDVLGLENENTQEGMRRGK